MLLFYSTLLESWDLLSLVVGQKENGGIVLEQASGTLGSRVRLARGIFCDGSKILPICLNP